MRGIIQAFQLWSSKTLKNTINFQHVSSPMEVIMKSHMITIKCIVKYVTGAGFPGAPKTLTEINGSFGHSKNLKRDTVIYVNLVQPVFVNLLSLKKNFSIIWKLQYHYMFWILILSCRTIWYISCKSLQNVNMYKHFKNFHVDLNGPPTLLVKPHTFFPFTYF